MDAPEVARIAERRVTLAIDAQAAEHLPERDAKGGPEFAADVRAGRLARFLRRLAPALRQRARAVRPRRLGDRRCQEST